MESTIPLCSVQLQALAKVGGTMSCDQTHPKADSLVD